MSDFQLPHEHKQASQVEKIYAELTEINKFEGAVNLFKLLSDSTRIRIYWLLSHHEECVVNIAAMLNMSSPAISHHLRALLEGGLIESRRVGKEVFYLSTDTETAELFHVMLELVMEVNCPEQVETVQASQEEIIHEIHSYLMKNLHERITIEDLAKKFHINTTTLKQTFKKVYGTSIAAHMKEHRMKRAAKLLQETDDNVGIIAQAVGYESQSRFTSAFKEVFGMVPTKYRKNKSLN